jgi:predicted CoA-binding protein
VIDVSHNHLSTTIKKALAQAAYHVQPINRVQKIQSRNLLGAVAVRHLKLLHKVRKNLDWCKVSAVLPQGMRKSTTQ